MQKKPKTKSRKKRWGKIGAPGSAKRRRHCQRIARESGKANSCECPNCRLPAVRIRDKMYCKNCDVVYVEREGRCCVHKIGILENLDAELSRVESKSVAVEETKPNYWLCAGVAGLAVLAVLLGKKVDDFNK